MGSVLQYPGSKKRIAPWIIKYMPAHHSYLEPYFGCGAVLFAKAPSAIETINDLDGEVVNFFSCHTTTMSTEISGAVFDCVTEYHESEKLEKEGKLIRNGNQLYRGALDCAMRALGYLLELCSYCNIKYKKLYRQSVKEDLNKQYNMYEELIKKDIAHLKWDIKKAEMKSIDKHNILEEINTLEKTIFWNSREL